METDFEGLGAQDQIDLYWTIESIWALAWVGGLHASLSFNTQVEDTLASMLPNIAENEPADQLVLALAQALGHQAAEQG